MSPAHLKHTYHLFLWWVAKGPRAPAMTGLTDRQFLTPQSVKSKNYTTVYWDLNSPMPHLNSGAGNTHISYPP